jgi:signal transduction histidine kinase
MTSAIEHRTRYTFLWVAIIPCLLGLVSLAVMVQYNRAIAWVSHTNNVLAAIDEVQLTLTSAESNQRGFLLTGDEQYLRSFRPANNELDSRLANLRRLTVDNPRQQKTLDRLSSAVHERSSRLQAVLALRRALPTADVVAAMSTGTMLMRRIQQICRDMKTEQSRLLNERVQAKQSLERQVGLSFTVGIAITLILLFWAHRSIQQYSVQRDRAEDALREKNIELERASKAKDQFLATMSHELRTPLNAILGFTGTLLMKLPGPLTVDQEKHLQTVRNSARHLLSLINDLLDLAKIESGRVELSLWPVVCQEMILELVQSLRQLAEAKGLNLEVEMPTEPITIVTDRRALSQILINLTNNAIKFTKIGSVKLKLGTFNESDRRETVISVSDTGIGIRPQDQALLFEAFQQIRDRQRTQTEGTGLGLHLSQQLARLLGGEITVQSEYGKGSTFTLALRN